MRQRLVVAVVVREGRVLSWATNEHQEACRRVGMPTGTGYDLCPGCDYPNHAEAKAVAGGGMEGATVFLHGHDYACDPCVEAMRRAGIAEYVVAGVAVKLL